MPAVQRYLDHPCFYIHDAEAELTPEEVPDTYWRAPPYIRRTDRVIAVGTIAEVDGEVCIKVEAGSDLEGTPVFSGILATPSGTLAITQSSGEVILRFEGLAPATKLTVGVDNLRHPQRVHVLAARP